MKETNYEKIKAIFENNGGIITRKDIIKADIPTWFLSDFSRRNNLVNVAPGVYVRDDYAIDEYYFLQRKYQKFIFSGLSSLYLNGLTDKIPTFISVTAPQGYNPNRHKDPTVSIRRISDPKIYELGVIELMTPYGNVVKAYGPERIICDLVKRRDNYDGETFVKAMKMYVAKYNNQVLLFEYARKLGVEKKVFEIFEVITNED
ncbi:MAG: type IV toxin-antitoxin system AbiEi family antitoxin domain-containing protein [Bacilli bacterium]|nr:type IV toxin-antitoxin system AbiEi family antitoxin domain-containing protein [Bacilli bacterium]